MEDQYGMADLSQFISGAPFYPPLTRPPPDLLSTHRGFGAVSHPYSMLTFRADSSSSSPNVAAGVANGGGAPASSSSAAGGGLIDTKMDSSGIIGGFDGGSGRWPRQETLTLLEIRSRLDPKFKEANQKGPLWDEVSRIMSEEHGYQRSGKKCREKFENLYKYYKKTKEGKTGRQDGKHYRFFRQLEAICGEPSNSASVSEAHFVGGGFHYNFPDKTIPLVDNQESYPRQRLSDASLISLSNSFNSDTTSSDYNDLNVGVPMDDPKKKRKGKTSMKSKIKGFIDAQMREAMEKQEAWMEQMMRTIELKEQERTAREEQWRKQDAARIERERRLWESEKAWIEARDAALMNAFQKLTGNVLRTSSPPKELMAAAEMRSLRENQNNDGSGSMAECEITRLIQLRSGMEVKTEHGGGISDDVLSEETATQMACSGHDRSVLMDKDKWDGVNNYLLNCNKKTKENPRHCSYYQNQEPVWDRGGGVAYRDTSGGGIGHTISLNDHANNNAVNAINDGFYRYFLADGHGRLI